MSYSSFTIALTLVIAGASPAWANSVSVAASDLPDQVEKVLPGVMNISSTTVRNFQVNGMEDFMRNWGMPLEQKSTSLGTGFLIDRDGYIITNNHVVDQATEVIVTLMDHRQFRAKIVGKDQKLDLALLQIRDKEQKVPADLSPVIMGDSEKVRIAESVFAVGNPFGLQHTVTAGIISAKNRTIGIGPFDNFLQTDASINPGNSGGPLFNFKGEVIGINAVIFSKSGQSGGLGFAIPINEAKAILGDLKKYGRVPRPWLGVLGQRITPQIQAYYGLALGKGVIISNLVQDAPAFTAGIKVGDIISKVDTAQIEEPNDLERLLNKHKPTENVTIQIQRGKKSLEMKFKLEELPKLDRLPPGII